MTMLTGSRIFLASCIAAYLVALTSPATAAEVDVGDTYESVIDELGQPVSAFEYKGEQWLEFDRGKVNLKDGKVVSTDLVSPAEARERKKKKEAAAAEARKAAKEKAERNARIAAEKKAKEPKKKAKPEVTEIEEPVGIPPGLNRSQRRKFSRSKSRQAAWSNSVVEARNQNKK